VDLELSDDELALSETAADVLAGVCPPAVVRAVFEGKDDGSGVWQQLVGLDWPGLTIAEEHGGVGMGFLDLAVVVEQIGRFTVPGPFLATTTQYVPAIREVGDADARARFLPPVAAGTTTGSLALAEGPRWGLEALATRAVPVGDGWRLTGRKDAVLHGATVDELVVVARGKGGLGAFVVPRTDVRVEARHVIDPTMPIADIILDDVDVPAERVLAAPGSGCEEALRRAIDEATVAMAVATVGTCRRIFEMTVDYAKERVQYDRPIGSFQALKHRLADVYVAVERAASLGWYAALTIAEDDPRRREAASLAKAAAADCQGLVVGEGLQMHGGIGLTWEHDLHFFLKRAKAGEVLLGGGAHHRAVLGTLLGIVDAPLEVTA
jgi:alkylation response protein AidB-like acyl-CoA dehydrogenase